MFFSGIFFFIFLFFLFLIIIGGSLLRGILNLLFGSRTTRRQYTTQEAYGQAQGQARQSTQSQQTSTSTGKKRDKIFDDSEGEYVDFEEIKE